MKLSEIEDRQAAIRSELNALASNEGTTEENDGDLRDTLIAEHESLDVRKEPIVERMEKLKLIQRQSREGGQNVEPADVDAMDGPVFGNRDGFASRGSGGNIPRTPEFMTRLDPFAELGKVRDGLVAPRQVLSRALSVIDAHNKAGVLTDDKAEESVRKASRQPLIARHMLLTGYPEYVEAFRMYLNDPQGEGNQAAQRNLTMGTASGGYLLPYVLDPTIVLTNSGSTNPYRQMSEVKQTTSNAWQGVNSAGVQMAWLDEAAAAAIDTSTVGQVQIYPKKGAAWVIGSFEFIGDTNYADQLPGMLADGKDIWEEQAFAVGTGGVLNAGQPKGIMTAIGGTNQRVLAAAIAGTVSVGAFPTGSATAVINVYNLNAALGPRFRMSPSVGWVANITNINSIRALDQYGGGSFWANLTSDQPERLLNKRIAESPSLTATATVGTAASQAVAVFGDWSKFYIIDRVGSTMLFDPMVKNTGSANRPTGEQGWFYFWRVGSDVATANAFRWLANGTG